MPPFFAAMKHGIQHDPHRPPYCLHVHDHHEIFYALEGTGKQMDHFGEKMFKAGDLFFFPEGHHHIANCDDGQKFNCLVISFNDAFYHEGVGDSSDAKRVLSVLCSQALRNSLVRLSAVGKEKMQRLLKAIHREFCEQKPGYQWAVQLNLQEFFLLLLRDPTFQQQVNLELPNRSNTELIQEVTAYAEAFFFNPITVDDVLKFCPLSKSHFHAVFKHETGQTFVQYLTEIRLKNACDWLIQTNDSITTIAFRCGFNSQSHFSYIFQKVLHRSPRAFREEYQNTKVF